MFDLQDLGVTQPREDPFLDTVADLAVHRLGLDGAAISFLNAQEKCFAVRRAGPAVPPGFARTSLEGAPCRVVIETGKALALSSPAEGERRFPRMRRLGMVSYLGTPVLGPADDPVGVVSGLSIRPRIWTVEERRILADIAELVRVHVLLAASMRTVVELGRDLAAARSLLRKEIG